MAAAVVPLKVEADETALALFKRTRSRPLRTGLAPLDRVSKLNTRLIAVILMLLESSNQLCFPIWRTSCVH
jgi:hypothetical protein